MGYPLCAFEIMGEGITPVSQPIDRFIGKIFKGYHRDFYDFYMLSAPYNDKCQPISPTRQLCARWVVDGWGTFTEDLIKKSWDISGYKNIHELHDIESYIHRNINKYENKQIIEILEHAGGSNAIRELHDPLNKVGNLDDNGVHEGTWE